MASSNAEHAFPASTPRASGTEAARVLVVAGEADTAHLTRDWLVRETDAICWIAHDAEQAVKVAREHRPEIAVVELSFRVCRGPATALRVASAARHLQTVFFAGPLDEAEMAAARDLGLGRVQLFEGLFSLLQGLVVPLAELVRLRRRLDQVEAMVRAFDAESIDAPPGVTLPEAERRYRETYVRSLLAHTGNRREAARRAGVPYTTLCEIMRKLGIADPE